MALHRLARPLVQHFLDVRPRAPGLQAQRIAHEVGLRRAVVQRQVEFLAEAAQAIGAIQGGRMGVGEQWAHRMVFM